MYKKEKMITVLFLRRFYLLFLNVDEKIERGMLYKDNRPLKHDYVMAAQIKDPNRGCSASICSHCREPIVFCMAQCPSCGYALIDAQGMPTIANWKRLDNVSKVRAVYVGFRAMVKNINSGDGWKVPQISLADIN